MLILEVIAAASLNLVPLHVPKSDGIKHPSGRSKNTSIGTRLPACDADSDIAATG